MRDDLRLEPIERWPGSLTVARRSSPFRASYSQTVGVLGDELRAVQASAVVVQLAVDRTELRNDGKLRASARPSHPGVIVSFTSHKLGKVRFACDRFLWWEDNLRAIALGMRALRAVDRYGITSDGEQYAGFRAIEAAETARAFETVEQAAEFVVRWALDDGADPEKVKRLAAVVLDDDELADTYYRRAAKRVHPDAGGDDVSMAKLTVARAMLDEAQS